MSVALINPEMLRWARLRAGLTLAEAAGKARIPPEKLERWERGGALPTFRQAQDLAQALHIPFGYLYLPSPPQDSLPIPDLRTVGDRQKRAISIDLEDVVTDSLRKQDWYREHLVAQEAEPVPFIGRFRVDDGVTEIARDISETLKLSIDDRDAAPDWEAFLNLLIERTEQAGVSVMRSGTVGPNTHRVLRVEEFRGFVVCDRLAPLIFLNGADARAAQIFTLVHELAHLWLGESGISDASLEPLERGYQRIERCCNAVAAEVLVPGHVLQTRWNPRNTLAKNAVHHSRFFRVSQVVVARRALDLGLIDPASFRSFYLAQAALWRRQKEQRQGGGSFYPTLVVRNGRRFADAVVRSALQERLLLRDAGRLLGVSPDKIVPLASHIGIG